MAHPLDRNIGIFAPSIRTKIMVSQHFLTAASFLRQFRPTKFI